MWLPLVAIFAHGLYKLHVYGIVVQGNVVPRAIGCGANKMIDGLVQDCSNSSANTLELLQSCTRSSEWLMVYGPET